MYKYAIKSIDTDLIGCSTDSERDYIKGDSEIILRKWADHPILRVFEESMEFIKFSSLPQDLRVAFLNFEQGVIQFIQNKKAPL